MHSMQIMTKYTSMLPIAEKVGEVKIDLFGGVKYFAQPPLCKKAHPFSLMRKA